MQRHAVIVVDTRGVIRQWNAGAEALFGHRADEALDQSLDLIVPAHLRRERGTGWSSACATPTATSSRS